MKMTKSIDVFLTDGCGRCSKFATDACTVRIYAPEIEALRSIALSVFQEETMKWGAPCYSHNGKNVAALFSFKDNCGFSFFKGPLLADTHQINDAKQSATRTARIEKYKPFIFKGIGQDEAWKFN
jgi:uncharacterized protein YdeI (YjbR/CyaY-like superfamily)